MWQWDVIKYKYNIIIIFIIFKCLPRGISLRVMSYDTSYLLPLKCTYRYLLQIRFIAVDKPISIYSFLIGFFFAAHARIWTGRSKSCDGTFGLQRRSVSISVATNHRRESCENQTDAGKRWIFVKNQKQNKKFFTESYIIYLFITNKSQYIILYKYTYS